MGQDVFISYSSSDLAIAETLHKCLVEAGFNVWFDKARLQPGCDWHKEIEQGCENSRVVLALLTPHWKLSEWTRYETYGAEAVIPLVVEGDWKDVSTPPLTQYQNLSIPIASASNADWQRLFSSIRDLCSRETPVKENGVLRLRFHPAKHFVGREKDLNEIHEKLFVNPTAALTQGHVQAIAAMGGVGKTTLARQYAEKFWRCYPQMFWVDFRLGLETEFAAIHDILRPEAVYAALSTADKAGWLKYEFNQSDNRARRLLILDNAEDEESVLEWIPKTGNCHTLITSRFTGWSTGIDTYRVWVLEPEPARALLLQRSGRAETSEEHHAADALANKLEYLPLALEQAAAYVAAQAPGWGFAEYLELYEANEQEFLAEQTPGATEYPDSVYLTWRATIDKLPQGARAILRLHAFMASTPTPVAMFVKGADYIVKEARLIARELRLLVDADINKKAGEIAVRRWIAALASYSMAKLETGDSFSVHGLVHAVEWHAMGKKSTGVLKRATDLFLSYAEVPSWQPESRKMWEVLLPHATRLATTRQELGRPSAIDILDRTCRAHEERGDFQAAILFAREQLILTELEFGPENPGTLESVHVLGVLLRQAGDYTASELLFRRAVEGRGRVLGVEHPDTLASINSLVVLLHHKGDYSAAEPLSKRTLESQERLLGPEHPDTLTSVGNMAALLAGKGDSDAAEIMYRRALVGRERVLGIEHPGTLTALSNLAWHLSKVHNYAAAEPMCRRALESRERVLGPEHPHTLVSLNNLVALLNALGDYEAAEPLCRRGLDARERVLGFEHPETLISVNTLAKLLHFRREYTEAEVLFRRALEARERVLGHDHPDTRWTASNLSLLLDDRVS